MRFDPQKAFPYPVLRPDIDDFCDGEFQATVDWQRDKEGHTLTLQVEFALSVDEIQREIDEERALFVAVVACRDTYLRRTIRTSSQTISQLFDGGQLRGEVLVSPYIISMAQINNFTSPDINTEFGEGPFEYPEGSVLATDVPRVVYIDRDLFKPVTSVFELVKSDNIMDKKWQLHFEEEHVQIVVSPSMKETIDSARNQTPHRAVLINSLYFSAVVQAIQYLRETNDYDDFRWACVIRQQAHNNSLELGDHDAYYCAQVLLKFPLMLLTTYVFTGENE